ANDDLAVGEGRVVVGDFTNTAWENRTDCPAGWVANCSMARLRYSCRRNHTEAGAVFVEWARAGYPVTVVHIPVHHFCYKVGS
ncbi:MAG: hypothetical protein MZV65_41155, partial [Chromatiales bacterium]|nr:hypothetical protein [Chromatiales bacterium]